MKILLMGLLLFYTSAFGVNINEDVDYWENSKKERKIEPPEKLEKAKELDENWVLKQSIKWYEEKIKKEKPPIEYLYFLNPEKYANAMREWVKWKQKKGNEIVKYQIIQARPEKVDLTKIIQFLNSKGYEILYFYSKTCKYCRFTEPEVKNIGTYIPVYWIEIHKEPEMFQKWNITTTPTAVFVSSKEKKAYRYKGAFTRNELLNYMYKVIKNEENSNPDNFTAFNK